MKKVNLKSLIIMVLLVISIVAGGCGTTGDAVTTIEKPEREEPVALATTTIPSFNLIVINDNVSPMEDICVGSAGAVEGNALVKIYDDLTKAPIYTVTAQADGSFTINVGDDLFIVGYVTATAIGKEESDPIGVVRM